jgi:hypothetical protein
MTLDTFTASFLFTTAIETYFMDSRRFMLFGSPVLSAQRVAEDVLWRRYTRTHTENENKVLKTIESKKITTSKIQTKLSRNYHA